MKLIQFGKIIPDLEIDGESAPYPVLNERDARAAAGIMLVIGSFAFVQAFLLRDFSWITAIIILFTLEFAIRLANPSLAPFYALGSLLVKNQRPEWSGAAQKRFAWSLGLLMASTMVVLVFGFGIWGLPNLIICLVCLSLLWMESALGVCVGCKMYYGLMRLGLVKKPDVMPACPGGVCAIPKKKTKK